MIPLNIVIAPDSFKESLTAKEACESIREGILEIMPRVNIMMVPMADGGEGTVQSLLDATLGKRISVLVHEYWEMGKQPS